MNIHHTTVRSCRTWRSWTYFQGHYGSSLSWTSIGLDSYWISLIVFKDFHSKFRSHSKDISRKRKHIHQSITSTQSQSQSQCSHVARTWANTVNAIFSSFSIGLYACDARTTSKHHQTFRRCFWWWTREAICCGCSTDSWECASGVRGSKGWWWSNSSCYRRNGRGACGRLSTMTLSNIVFARMRFDSWEFELRSMKYWSPQVSYIVRKWYEDKWWSNDSFYQMTDTSSPFYTIQLHDTGSITYFRLAFSLCTNNLYVKWTPSDGTLLFRVPEVLVPKSSKSPATG